MIEIKTIRRLDLPKWATYAHPVFRLERQRQQRARGTVTLRNAFIPLTFLVTGFGILSVISTITPLLSSSNLSEFIPVALSVTLAVMIAIQLVMGALANVLVITQTTPAISGEIELQSWRLLRTTTLPLREIIWAKFGAALFHLRTILAGLLILRVISSVTAVLLLLFALTRGAFHFMGPDQLGLYFAQLEWLPLLMASFVFTIGYVGQPLIQFVLNGTIGLVTSASTRTRAQAVAAGLVMRLVIWVFVMLVNAVLIFAWTYAFSDWVSPYSARLAVFRGRPSPGELEVTWVLSISVIGYTLSILFGQLALILVGLGLVHRRTRHLGV